MIKTLTNLLKQDKEKFVVPKGVQDCIPIKRGINPDLKIDGILFTMVDARTVNDRSVIESMREAFGMKINVFDTFIPASVRVTEANMEGKSIFAYDNKCKVADAYKVRKGFGIYCAVVLVVALMFTMSMTAFAANDDPLTVVNNLSDFIFGLIRAIGLIMLGFGIVQVGLSLKSHDPSQRANGFLTVAGGIVITFAKEILNLITG